MAFFSKTKSEKGAERKPAEVSKKEIMKAPVLAQSEAFEVARSVILRPRVTEKAALLNERHTYVFEVARNATKRTVARAIQMLYKIEPVAVRIVPIRSKTLFMKGKRGSTQRGKKAYVELKATDKIEV